MRIVNIIKIGDKNVKFSELTDIEKKNIAVNLIIQAMTALGYKATDRK